MIHRKKYPDMPQYIFNEVRSSEQSDRKKQARIQEFLSQYEQKRKRPDIAMLLAIFMGFHYFYLGKLLMAVLYWITIGGFGIWWLADIFRARGMTQQYNADVAIKLYNKIIN